MRVIIPSNFDDDGGVFGGLIRKRNAAEATGYAVIMYFLTKLVYKLIPHLFVVALFLVVTILGITFLLLGFGDTSLVTIIMDQMKYNKTKCVALLMRPSDIKHK